MNVLLIGDSGLIGKRLKDYLIGKGHEVTGVSRSASDIDIDCVLPLTFEAKNKLEKSKFDSVVFSAFRIPKSKEDDNDILLSDNLKIIDCVKEIIDLVKPESVVNFSSMAVYPNVSGSYSETSEVNPEVNWNSNYGRSKLNSEEILTKIAQDKKVNVAHLRVTQLIDEEGSDLLQKSFDEEYDVNNEITVFANGERESNFIGLNYLCEVVELVMNKRLNGVFNAGDKQINYLDFAKKYIHRKGGDVSQIKLVPQGYKTKVIVDCSKLKNAIEH
jgi:nucleoside-diphosphate-sugar epimerase